MNSFFGQNYKHDASAIPWATPSGLAKQACTAQSGYATLAAVLTIFAVIVSIGLATASQSLTDLQSSRSLEIEHELLDLVEGCAADALLTINETGTIPSSVTLPEISCTVTTLSQVGDNYQFSVAGSLDDYDVEIEIDLDRTNTLTINAWTEGN